MDSEMATAAAANPNVIATPESQSRMMIPFFLPLT